MSKPELPDWEQVLSSAAHLQQLLPGSVLVGGTAAALYADHRRSSDADHVIVDLRERFDTVLAQLESVAGWKTARINRPVLILGSLDGIETGIRQLIRTQPLEVRSLVVQGHPITLPTEAEMLRIKAALILKRNATRDYLDFAALAQQLGEHATAQALRSFDELYPQPNGQSALQQLQVQLTTPLPFDLEGTDLSEYKDLKPQWHNWNHVQQTCRTAAIRLFDRLESDTADSSPPVPPSA
jgi:hypothetical protein